MLIFGIINNFKYIVEGDKLHTQTLRTRLISSALISISAMVAMLLSSCSTLPVITWPTKIASGTAGASTNGWATLTFSECRIGGVQACYVYSQVTGGSSVHWQEWQWPNKSRYFLLIQDYWKGFLPSEPGVPSGLLNQAHVSAWYQRSLHYDGTKLISTVHPDSSLSDPSCNDQLPTLIPCDESYPDYNGHQYVNGTYDDALLFYTSQVGDSPIVNWIEVYPLRGNP